MRSCPLTGQLSAFLCISGNRRDKMTITLAGKYPAGTKERLQALLHHEAEIRLVDTPEAHDTMTDAEIVVLRVFKAPRAFIERNPNLKMIMRWGVGVDSVDLDAAGEHGVIVTNTPGANAGAVSELAVLLMLAVGRKLLCHTKCLHEGVWSKTQFTNSSYCLDGKVVGIVGGGNIGRQVAKKVQAFGASTQYYDVFRLGEEREAALGMPYRPLDELLQTSDIITLHIPLLDSTFHIIGERELGLVKQGAILVNTARGGLVDDHALFEAVHSGHLAGAGLDGVEEEPLPADHEFYTDPNFIVTPHVGGGTADLGDKILPMLAEDIDTFAEGKLPAHTVNKAYFN